MLQVHFEDARLRDLGTRESLADEQLGAADARALRALIAEAEAFLDAAALIDFRLPTPPMGDSLAIPFGVDCMAHFRPVFPDASRRDDGGTDWTRVKRIMLTRIET